MNSEGETWFKSARNGRTEHGCVRIVEHRATYNICTHLSRSGASRFHYPTHLSRLRGLGRLRGWIVFYEKYERMG